MTFGDNLSHLPYGLIVWISLATHIAMMTRLVVCLAE